MINARQFSALLYRRPYPLKKAKLISRIVGFDSETLIDGTPFMFCTSEGDSFTPDQIPSALFTPKYVNSNFVLFNLKFDVGSILRVCLPHKLMYDLWSEGILNLDTEGSSKLLTEIEHDEYTFKYIPHKQLVIKRTHHKDKITFWDISQFYQSSLDFAAKKYLNRQKLSLHTKRFTASYAKHCHKSISRYCIQDATLTRDLALYLIAYLQKLNITPINLYSCASISHQYFRSHTTIPDVYALYKYNTPALMAACDAYEGGKFEVTSRGYFPHVYEYDIASAYPYEISRLVSIKNCTVFDSPKYHADAIYGFLQCRIDNTPFRYLPCGIKSKSTKNTRIYPAGVFYTTITKCEYEYLIEIGTSVTIIRAFWLFVPRKYRPYSKIVKLLYSYKDSFKHTDPMMYHNVKVILNGYYGKLAQVTELPDGTLAAGSAWNPIHASEITARTRIAVCRIQNALTTSCLAVHTDSVITTKKISVPTPSLGSFSYEREGPAYLIACGMYQIGEDSSGCAFKGFNPPHGETWKNILTKFKRYKRIPYWYNHVMSWVEAMSRNKSPETINIFSNTKKIIDLNCDNKRLWIESWNGERFLTQQENSLPRVSDEKSPPNYWSKIFSEEHTLDGDEI